MAPGGPAVQRRQLGSELRRLREAKGLKMEQVAARMGCSATRISRIETTKGTVVVTADDVRGLCELYGVSEAAKVDMLLGMLAASQQKEWWEPYEAVMPSGLQTYVSLETEARAERAWEPQVVHGALQTPEYARAVLQAANRHRPHDIGELVEVRMERQKLLTRTDRDPLDLWTVLDEAVLRRLVCGRDAMRAQLHHLLESAELPHVTIQILPFGKGAHPALDGAFSLLEFEAEERPVVYVESPAGNLYLEKVRDVRRVAANFDYLRALALDPHESTALIRAVMEEM